ncbi:MAG: hypothetical protein ABSA80_15265 [Terriglobales bacterium]
MNSHSSKNVAIGTGSTNRASGEVSLHTILALVDQKLPRDNCNKDG